jgi:hypothetical protein
MEGQPKGSSPFSSATVVAAIISSVTALLAALLPGLLSSREDASVTPTPPSGLHATPSDEAPGFTASREAVPASEKPNLTLGAWTIVSSSDEEGTDFSGSTLKFTTQREIPGGLEAMGFFEWRSGGQVLGHEHVVGTYHDGSRHLYIEGKYVESPSDTLAIGSFSARLSDDGRQLLEGTWGNTPGNRVGVLGKWEARR